MMKCDGCKMSDRDESKATTFRPDGMGDIFTLCALCIETVGRYWSKHYEPLPSQGRLQQGLEELQACQAKVIDDRKSRRV
jgi:hypothetical protein